MVLLQNAGVERDERRARGAAVRGGAGPRRGRRDAVRPRASGPLAWLGFGVALGGVGLVAGSGGGSSPAGDGLMLLSALCQATFVVAQARLLDGRDPIAVTAVQMAAAALVALPVRARRRIAAGAGAASAGEAGAVAALVVAGTLLPFAFFAFGQARVRPEVVGAFANLEPLVGAGVAVLAFGDAFGPLQALGAGAILGRDRAQQRTAGRPGAPARA